VAIWYSILLKHLQSSRLTPRFLPQVNGPDSTVDSDWTDAIQRASASGKIVLGYVRTGYLGISVQQFTTRLSSHDTSNWVAQIEEDVDMWYNLYPDIGGIFFDEAWNECGTDNVYSNLYQTITQNTKIKHAGAYTILNPGAPMPQCFEDSADTLTTFEGDYVTYTTNFVPNDWTPTDPSKLWHIIFNVPDDMGPSVAALALQRGAGHVEVTNGVLPNPYDTLPPDAAMQEVFDVVSGGVPSNMGLLPPAGGGPASNSPQNPTILTIESFDYTSVTLSWTPAVNAVGYRIYANALNGPYTLAVPADTNLLMVGGLTPGTSVNTFSITALGGDGSETDFLDTKQSPTEALPEPGQFVANISASPSDDVTIFQASVLVPYGFVRVFIWSDVDECTAGQGWTINYSVTDWVCALYMVEDDTFYKYSGSLESNGDLPWEWTELDSVTVVQSAYEFTWTVPIGTSTINTSNFVIQVQGYNPFLNVFHPCSGVILDGGPDGNGRYCL
jgi:hypothetical protein